MRTPLQAILWELWKTGRNEFLTRVGCCFLVVAFCLAPVEKLATGPEMEVLHGCILIVLAQMSIVSAVSWRQLDSHRSGFAFRLGFARPVSTFMLVAVPMVFALVNSVACFALPALLLKHVKGVPFPILGPAMVIACCAAMFMTASFSPATVFGKRLAVLSVFVGTFALVIGFHINSGNPDPLLMVLGRPDYYNFAWYVYPGLVLFLGLLLAVTVASVERQRHGDRSFLEDWIADLARKVRNALTTSSTSSKSPFAGAFTAQCWYEFRRMGPNVFVLSAFGTVVITLLVSIIPLVDSSWNGSAIAWLLGLACCPFVFQLVGADSAVGLRARHGAVWLSEFDATRGMSNDRLITCKLFVIALCTLVGWSMMALTAGIQTALAGTWHLWANVGESASNLVGDVSVYWWIAGAASAVLLYISSTSVFLTFGYWLPKHPRLFTALAGSGYLMFFLGFLTVKNDWPFRNFWIAFGYVAAVAILVVSILTLRKALVAGSLGKRMFGFTCCLWGVYVASIVILYIRSEQASMIPMPVLAVAASLLIVPLAATACAPLALASHRHG